LASFRRSRSAGAISFHSSTVARYRLTWRGFAAAGAGDVADVFEPGVRLHTLGGALRPFRLVEELRHSPLVRCRDAEGKLHDLLEVSVGIELGRLVGLRRRVLVVDGGLHHLRAHAEDEDTAFDVQVELEGFQNLDDRLVAAAVEVVHKHGESSVRVGAQQLVELFFEGQLEGVAEGHLHAQQIAELVAYVSDLREAADQVNSDPHALAESLQDIIVEAPARRDLSIDRVEERSPDVFALVVLPGVEPNRDVVVVLERLLQEVHQARLADAPVAVHPEDEGGVGASEDRLETFDLLAEVECVLIAASNGVVTRSRVALGLIVGHEPHPPPAGDWKPCSAYRQPALRGKMKCHLPPQAVGFALGRWTAFGRDGAGGRRSLGCCRGCGGATVLQATGQGPIDVLDARVRLAATPAAHRDLTSMELLGDEGAATIGLRMEVCSDDGNVACTIGITGDTGWTQQVSEAFTQPEPVDLLVVHIGSVYEQDRTTEAYAESHLGWRGTRKLVEDVGEAHGGQAWLAVVSEWGEELARWRTQICQGLQRRAGAGRVVPGVRGLYIALPQCEPVCQLCRRRFATGWLTPPEGDIIHVCEDDIHGRGA
jgi:hypothetical protein